VKGTCRRRSRNPLDRTTTTGNSSNRRGKLSVPAGFVGISGRLRFDQVAGSSGRLHRHGIMTPMLGIGREKLGQTRSLMPHHSVPTYAVCMTRFDWQRYDRCVTNVCHLGRGDRSDQRFRKDDHAE
jgi:hypothetical protein